MQSTDFLACERALMGMQPMGSYDLRCPVARTADLIGERWTALIIRDLLRADSLKFADLSSSLPGISPTTLSIRLQRLENAGVIGKRLYEQHPPRAQYFLTSKGRALGPLLRAMKEWGESFHKQRAGAPLPGPPRS